MANTEDSEKSLAPEATFQVTLHRSRKTGRVLFLEAGKDLVDVLFSFLLLPVGTIIHMLSQGIQVKPAVGGFSSIFESMEQLDSSFFHADMKVLLEPKLKSSTSTSTGTWFSTIMLQLSLETAKLQCSLSQSILPKNYYKCNFCSQISSKQGERCEYCRYCGKESSYIAGPFHISTEEAHRQASIQRASILKANLSIPLSISQGFVLEATKFIVTDKLQIMPSSTTTGISILNKLGVSSLADLKINDATISISQIFQLLPSAQASNTCLTDVFGKK